MSNRKPAKAAFGIRPQAAKAADGNLDLTVGKNFTKQIKVKNQDGSIQVVSKDNITDAALEMEVEEILNNPKMNINGDIIKKV